MAFQKGTNNAGRLFIPRGKSTNPSGINLPAPIGGNGGNGGGSDLFLCPYNVYTIPLDAAFPPLEFNFIGTIIWAANATDNTVLCYLRFENSSNPAIPLYAPARIGGFPYTKFYIENLTAQPTKTITIFTALDMNALQLEVG